MNKQQKAYLLAKAKLEALEQQENEVDRLYIIEKGIKNPDGSIPTRTYMIENDELADKAIDDVGKILVESGLWAKILEARKELKAAEENLINYGLSIIPERLANEKETLTRAAKTNYTVRRKIIDLVFRLDTSTVTA
jgi:hypothetical protein